MAEPRPEPQDAIPAARPLPPKSADGRWPSPQEIQDLLADEGYSADDRKGWLKEVLTDLETEHAARPSDDKRQLLDDIKSIADTYQSGKPVTDDVL